MQFSRIAEKRRTQTIPHEGGTAYAGLSKLNSMHGLKRTVCPGTRSRATHMGSELGRPDSVDVLGHPRRDLQRRRGLTDGHHDWCSLERR